MRFLLVILVIFINSCTYRLSHRPVVNTIPVYTYPTPYIYPIVRPTWWVYPRPNSLGNVYHNHYYNYNPKPRISGGRRK